MKNLIKMKKVIPQGGEIEGIKFLAEIDPCVDNCRVECGAEHCDFWREEVYGAFTGSANVITMTPCGGE